MERRTHSRLSSYRLPEAGQIGNPVRREVPEETPTPAPEPIPMPEPVKTPDEPLVPA